jgi:hypothetical protein
LRYAAAKAASTAWNTASRGMFFSAASWVIAIMKSFFAISLPSPSMLLHFE